jgi:hypothetical protein
MKKIILLIGCIIFGFVMKIQSQTTDSGFISTGNAGGNHSFVGKKTNGVFTNWLNTGRNATAFNLIGNSNQHAGFGVIDGPHIVSPVVWMYINPNNSFSVRRMDYLGDITSGSALLTVRSSGRVGIGTENPDSKLTVNGTIHSKEVLVDLNIPADYVFQKYYTGFSSLKETYQMPTLEEVEAFTKENHHLPNVPSASTIQKEGMQLSEMTNLLLQKIEELTLYTIEQEKRIKALEGKLKKKK